MAKSKYIRPNERRWHKITLAGWQGGMAILVGGGRYSHLSVWTEDRRGFVCLQGQVALRALARAILKEVPAPKPRRGRKA